MQRQDAQRDLGVGGDTGRIEIDEPGRAVPEAVCNGNAVELERRDVARPLHLEHTTHAGQRATKSSSSAGAMPLLPSSPATLTSTSTSVSGVP